MYQLKNPENEWDTDLFHELMSDKRIHSSKEAKQIRENLTNAGALPHFDNHFDWAMLCISYCFVKGWAYQPKELLPVPDTKGTEIPSFNTCFQDYARLWLALLSDALFHNNPKTAVNKDDLYDFIETLWHTGAVKLNERWQDWQNCHRDDELAQRQAFLDELTQLAIKNAGVGSSNAHSPNASASITFETENLTDKMVQILQKDLLKGVKKADFLGHGVRYDFYRIQFARHVDWDRIQEPFCSAMSLPETSVWAERDIDSGLPHAYRVKILRDENQWQSYGKTEFQAALKQYSAQQYAFKLPVLLGIDEQGQSVFGDLTAAVHSFVAGKTGSGKSVFVHGLLNSLFQLNSPQQVQVVILDPKKTEYTAFTRAHADYLYQGKIITETSQMLDTLQELVDEMESRNDLLQQNDCRNIAELPDGLVKPRYLLVVVDEVANLLSQFKEVEGVLSQLAEKARSAGIFLLLSTQTPNSETFSQRLRANVPTRIAFGVVNAKASEIILGESGLGAEKLNIGDHLVRWNGGTPQFLHGYNM